MSFPFSYVRQLAPIIVRCKLRVRIHRLEGTASRLEPVNQALPVS